MFIVRRVGAKVDKTQVMQLMPTSATTLTTPTICQQILQLL